MSYIGRYFQSGPFYCFFLHGKHEAGKKCAEISYFDIDLKTTIRILKLITCLEIRFVRKELQLAWENGFKLLATFIVISIN